MKRLLMIAIAGIVILAACSPQQVDEFSIPENAEIRSLIIPEKDVFSGSEILDLSDISQEELEAVVFHVNMEDATKDELIITDEKKIAEIYRVFADTRIAVDIMSTMPDTGNQLDMVWYFSNKTQTSFLMRGYLVIEGYDSIYGTYVFTEGFLQEDYFNLYIESKK